MLSNCRRIPETAVLPVHTANALTGEAPLWDETRGVLWWIDIQGQRLLGFEPATGHTSRNSLPMMPGLLALRENGSLLIGLEDGFYPFSPEIGLGSRIFAVEADNPLTRINDGKADRDGNLWFGTMNKVGLTSPTGAIYVLKNDLSLHTVREDVQVPNAIGFSPDGRTVYFADSSTGVVETANYVTGSITLSENKTFVAYDAPEKPDGICVDVEGAVWIAVTGGGRRLERRLADGTLDTIVDLPVSRPTMPALGGRDGLTLFITSQRRVLSNEALATEPLAGDLLAVRVNVPAAPAFTVRI